MPPDKEIKQKESDRASRHNLIGYWSVLIEGASYSPTEFYDLVLSNLDFRKVPDLLYGYVFLHERTVFSKRRLYLQLRRERLVFEICAAPFGTGFFVSSRFFDMRQKASAGDWLIVLSFLAAIAAALFSKLGTFNAVIGTGYLITFLWSLMRLAAGWNVTWLDDRLCRIPVLGAVYETLFHPDTYYRQDQNAMYSASVRGAVQDSMRQFTESRGLRLPEQIEPSPRMPTLSP